MPKIFISDNVWKFQLIHLFSAHWFHHSISLCCSSSQRFFMLFLGRGQQANQPIAAIPYPTSNFSIIIWTWIIDFSWRLFMENFSFFSPHFHIKKRKSEMKNKNNEKNKIKHGVNVLSFYIKICKIVKILWTQTWIFRSSFLWRNNLHGIVFVLAVKFGVYVRNHIKYLLLEKFNIHLQWRHFPSHLFLDWNFHKRKRDPQHFNNWDFICCLRQIVSWGFHANSLSWNGIFFSNELFK